jgi:hypothetical protein
MPYKYLTLVEAWHSPSPHGSTDNYKEKVRFVIQNGGKDIELWTPLWESKEVVHQSPMISRFQLEGPKGYREKDLSKEEFACISLSPGQSVAGWIGLLQPAGEGLPIRVKRGTTGFLVFPIKMEGKLTFERIAI